jgi:SAM-dependent methyltransferase
VQTHRIFKNNHTINYAELFNDSWRNRFFQKALIKHAYNKVVLDMGTGTGILAFYALSAGAKFVYCIDVDSKSCAITEKLLSKQFDKSRFKVINGNFWSNHIFGWHNNIDNTINHEIDILVTETIGPGLFDQGMFHTWHYIKPFLSKEAISIPDRLHADIWFWNKDNFDLESNPKNTIICDNLLDKDLAKAMIEIDIEIREFYASISMEWVNINAIKNSPSKIYKDIFSYGMHEMPNLLFHSNRYPKVNHIIPNISFDLIIDKPEKLSIVNKLSFEQETLYIKDAMYMPWQENPLFHIEHPGQYQFTYSNFDLIHKFTSEWVCTSLSH